MIPKMKSLGSRHVNSSSARSESWLSVRSVAGFAAVLLTVLLVGADLGEGLYGPRILYGPPVPVLQAQSPGTSETYYANATTLVDLPLQELIKTLPELRGLDLAAGEQRLPQVLDSTGKSVADS